MKAYRKVLAAMCSTLLLFGCAQTQETEEPEVQEEEKELLVIGTESDKAKDVVVKNEMGQNIVSIEMKKATEDNLSKNLLKDDEVLKEGEEARWYYEPETNSNSDKEADDEENADSQDLEATLIQKPFYTVVMKLEDDTEVTFRTFCFENLGEDTVLKQEDGVGYVEFTDAEGKQVSTLEQEKEAAENERLEKEQQEEEKKKQEEEKKKQEEEQQKEEEQQEVLQEQQPAVSQEPVYEEPSYQEPVYTEPVYEEPVYEQPSTTTPDVGTQDSGNCFDYELVPNPDYSG